MINCLLITGYGFVDFESHQAAEVAVQALQAQGIQAQMAKVSVNDLTKVQKRPYHNMDLNIKLIKV